MLGVSRRHSITDEFFPSFFHLIIWGHEHESIPQAVEVIETGVNILQPGSTVATSLILAESLQKHSFQLYIHEKSFKITPTPLLNTRPILYKQIILSKSGIDPFRTDLVENYLRKEIKKMLREVDFSEKPLHFQVPLIRFKIEYTGYSIIKGRSINKLMMGKVANPTNILQWHKKQKHIPAEKG